MTEEPMDSIIEDIDAINVYYAFWDIATRKYLLDTENNYLHVADSTLGVFMFLHCSPIVDVRALSFDGLMKLADECSGGKYTILDVEKIYNNIHRRVKKKMKHNKKKIRK